MERANDMVVALATPPLPDLYEAICAQTRAREAASLGQMLEDDFIAAWQKAEEGGLDPGDRRAVVRCFGSLIDGLANVMRDIAVIACEYHGQEYNRFLDAKSRERTATTLQRISANYRVLYHCLPKSPLARIPDERWTNLRAGLEIRNRVVHPEKPADLEVRDADLALVQTTGMAFVQDFRSFVQWQGQRQQRLGWEAAGGARRRDIPKTGRNAKCPCGSQRKYKNCCAAAQWAA